MLYKTMIHNIYGNSYNVLTFTNDTKFSNLNNDPWREIWEITFGTHL